MDHSELAELQQLAELPEKNPGPVARLGRDGTIQMANAATRRFLGRDDIVGKCWLDLCPGMTREIWQEVEASAGSEDVVLHESQIDGAQIDGAQTDGARCIHFTYVVSDGGDTVFAYGADITTLREHEKVVSEQQAQIAEMARFPEMNPGPVLRTDREGVLLLANAAAREVFGERLIGKRWTELCPGIEPEMWRKLLRSFTTLQHRAHFGDRVYVFAHRYDPKTELVFVFGADITKQELAERAMVQSERMAQLGTLAAGIAHELNNPAAATRRAADQLRDSFLALHAATTELAEVGPEGAAMMAELHERAERQAVTPSTLGSLERSDRESELEDWLDDRDVEGAWDLAPGLVDQGIGTDDLERMAAAFDDGVLGTVLAWSVNTFRVHQLAYEIGQGSGRISEIVGALKTYSYLGQAPVQAVDVHEGLESTLVIMRNKLKSGVEVVRDYGEDLPPVAAYGSELNQVWTNLLDNAADAIYSQEKPAGTVVIRTRRDGDRVAVEIEDDGPGIPAEIQPRLFDPFFTTKEPGKGTGLGLSTTYSIITEKHHGTITVQSRPQRTVFTVSLPTDSARST